MPESILEWGITVVLAFQVMGDWLTGPMNFFTFTGYLEFYLLVLPAIYWCYNRVLGIRLVIALMITIGLNLILKITWHDPRPYWVDSNVKLLSAQELTFGIPSGHSQTSLIFWGILATHFKKGWFWAVTLTIVFFTGISRIYLGVHFPTDVLVGWTLGLISLLLFLRLEAPLTAWLQQINKWGQIALIFGGTVLAIGITAIISWSVTEPIPTEWLNNMALPAGEHFNPYSLDDLIVSMGALFGLAAGVILFDSQFEAGGPLLKRVGRYLVGLIGVILLWRGLGLVFALFAPDDTALAYTLRYIRYTLIGVWTAAWAPQIFIKLGLAEAVE